ncbi:hypothetical protein Bpfe_020363 [Biomphalaria pfeifferi]|uniref:Uncharacterized protein n=1 Tax=Biomphalaria pfeifferi TaxID=112525 RepID=A0AAD8BB76_BIOPF|nr:hypothetical protein Bpfe_020363 [Biomphalaria pfeifferi]
MMDKVFPSPDTNTTIEMEFVCKPIGGDNAYRIVKNFSKVIKKGGKFSVYLMYNETSENKVVCFVNTDTESVEIEVLHFEWRPSDCVNPNYNITVYRQAFYCSWTERKKIVQVPSPQNIPITFLKQTGFVWIEVQTEVADSRYTTLHVTCNLVPSKTLSPEISAAKRNLQTVASTASPTASISISTRNNGTTTTKQSRPKTTKTPIITNTPPMVTLTTTDMRTAPGTTSNTSSLSSAPDKREATKSKVPSKTLSPEISVTNRNLQTVASTASPTASISISTRNNGTTTTKQSRPKTTKTPIITNTPITTNTPPMVTLTTTDMRTAPETTSNTSSLSSAPDKREATKSKVPSKTLSPEISAAKRNLQTVASTASPTASISISTRNNGTTTTKQSRPKTTKTPIITNTPPMVTLTTTDMRTAPGTTSNTSSLSSAPDKREATKSKVANFNDQCLPVIITLCVLLTIAVAVILFLAYKLKKRRSLINVYSTTKGSNQDIHHYNDTVDLNQYETVREASLNIYNNQLSNVLILKS